ncbi:MAG: formate dehydrogenase accessory protein FdhE [Coriobacteriia bacterium]
MADSARAKSIAHYSEKRPDLAQQLAFFEKLWSVQDEFAKKAAPYAPAPLEDLERALRNHQTMFSLVEPTIPLDDYRDAVRAVAAVMAEAGLSGEQTAALAEVDLGDAVTAGALADALDGFDVFVQSVSDAIGDDRFTTPLLSFVLTEAMTPFLREPAKSGVEATGKFDWLQWDSGLCPACGTPASSAVIRDEGVLQGGRRWLSCPTCRTQWEYARIRCTRCGTRTHTDLEYLYDEEDPAHRIHICSACHGYTPVVFEREQMAVTVPEVEEVVMVPLEAVAAERGYTPLGDDKDEMPN